MKNNILLLGALAIHAFGFSQVGINTDDPTNMLHIKGETGEDPLRVESLQVAGANIIGSLVTDNTGVVKLQNSSSISAVRATGNVVLVNNNTQYPTNETSAPVKAFDNLNEFSGNTFTASQTGLYLVHLSADFFQRTSASDQGDGYLGTVYFRDGGGTAYSAKVKVTLPESGGVPTYNTCNNSVLIKLNSGDTLQFRVTSYGTTGGVSADYKINIVRID